MRKRGRKASIEENTPRAPKSSKRASNAKKDATKPNAKQNRRVTTNAATDDEESEEEQPPYVPPVKDISQEIYTLSKMVIVGVIPIVSDTDFLKLDEFNFREFVTMNIRKADEYAKKGGFEFDTGPSTATLSAKGVRVMDNIVISVEDSSSWKKVEQGIKRWMLAGKKEIVVKLNVVYPKASLSHSEESEEDGPPRKKVSTLFYLLI